MTARGAKFSEAIISRVPRWRPSSWSRTAAISGSSSASGWLLTVEVLTEVGEVVTKNSWLGMGTAKGQATGWNVAPPVDFFFQAEDGIRDLYVTGVQTCALPICRH